MTTLWNISGRHSGLVSHHIQESRGSAAQDQGLGDVLPEECSLLPVHSVTAWDGKYAHPQATLLCHSPYPFALLLLPSFPFPLPFLLLPLFLPAPLLFSLLSPLLAFLPPPPLPPSTSFCNGRCVLWTVTTYKEERVTFTSILIPKSPGP